MNFWRFWTARHISRANCVEINIDKDKLRMKCSALNIDFDDPSLYFLGSMKFADEGIKSLFYRCWLLFRENGCRYTRRHGHVAYSQQALMKRFLVVLTLITLKDPELTKYRILLFFFAIFVCGAHFKSEFRRNDWRYKDNLRTGTAFARFVRISSKFLLKL